MATTGAGCTGLFSQGGGSVHFILVLYNVTVTASEAAATLRLDPYPHCEDANFVDTKGQRRLVLWDHDGPRPHAVLLHKHDAPRPPERVEPPLSLAQRHALVDDDAGSVALASLADGTVHLLDVTLLSNGSVRFANQTVPVGGASAPVEVERVLHRANVTFTVRENLTVHNVGPIPLEIRVRQGCD